MSRAAYYKWLNRETPENELENRRIATLIEEIHNGSPDKGYRRIKDELKRYHGIDVNDKRILRICRSLGIKSTIKYANDNSRVADVRKAVPIQRTIIDEIMRTDLSFRRTMLPSWDPAIEERENRVNLGLATDDK